MNPNTWQLWAILSAVFAAMTAIFAKIGVTDIDSDLATFLRTIVILVVLGVILATTQKLDLKIIGRLPVKSLLFLTLSGLATGASWLSYFHALKLGEASQVAPVDKLSVVLVAIFGVLFLGEKMESLDWAGITLIATGVILTVL